MKYLLDTNTFIWILNIPEAIPTPVQKLVADRSSILLVSIATPWEMAIKVASGKLDAGNILDRFEDELRRGKFTMLETLIRHVIDGGRLPLHHRDPFDRLLAAQALDMGIPLLSRDSIFDGYGVPRIWN